MGDGRWKMEAGSPNKRPASTKSPKPRHPDPLTISWTGDVDGPGPIQSMWKSESRPHKDPRNRACFKNKKKVAFIAVVYVKNTAGLTPSEWQRCVSLHARGNAIQGRLVRLSLSPFSVTFSSSRDSRKESRNGRSGGGGSGLFGLFGGRGGPCGIGWHTSFVVSFFRGRC